MRGIVPLCLLCAGCFKVTPSDGGGVEDPPSERAVDAADVLVPDGYTVDVVATGLDLPTSVTFDDAGRPCVTEAGYSYGELFREPRLVCLADDGARDVVATGDNPPWNGVTFAHGAFWVAEGGVKEGGRILKITPQGEITVMVEGLPSLGDHHTNGPAVGPDGYVYFGQGTATNSGVVGPDNADFGWLARHPDFHDVPCEDVTLAGANFTSDDALDGDGTRITGAFVPYGTRTTSGQIVPGRVPCSGAVMRFPVEGGPVELVAWGLRNPFGLHFGPDGQLYVTDNGYDDRGSRPVFGGPELLVRIEPGAWYGWPDYAGGDPISQHHYTPPQDGDPPPPVLADPPSEPPRPLARLGVHAAAVGLDIPSGETFGGSGFAYVALFGDMAPNVGKVVDPVGFRVLQVDLADGTSRTFAANVGKEVGPASYHETKGLERPVDVGFGPDGRTMYVVDFGILGMAGTPLPVPETGVLWRIVETPANVASAETP